MRCASNQHGGCRASPSLSIISSNYLHSSGASCQAAVFPASTAGISLCVLLFSWHHFHIPLYLPPSEVARCQSLRWHLIDPSLSLSALFLPLSAALYLLNTGFKVHSAGCNYTASAVTSRVKHSPLSAHLSAAGSLQPEGNCIAVSLWLMSCQRNCFTVWPLVFQTSAPVKDLRRADEGWEVWRMRGFLLMCVCGCRISILVL